MKFVCDNCGTQYLISDEKVGPKGAKIRCKRCGNVILLRPGESGTEPEGQKETSVPTDRNMLPETDEQGEDRDELGEAFDQLLKGGLDGGEDDDQEEEHQATEIFNMEELHRLRDGDGADEEQDKIDQVFSQAESTDVVRSKPAPEEDREEWYVAIGDEQVGPLVLAEIEKKWESGEVGPENLAWHPGMGDWTAVKDVPKLRYLLGAMAKEPADTDDSPFSGQPSPATSEDEWAPSGGSSLSSLVEEEIQAAQSTEVDAEAESDSGKSEVASDLAPDEGQDGSEEGEVPPWEREDVVSGEVARPADNFFDSTLDQASPGNKDDTGSARAERELARPAYLTSQTKRKSSAKMIIIVLVILVVLGGGAVGVYLATQKTTDDNSTGMTPIEKPDSDEKGTAAGKQDGKPEDGSKKATGAAGKEKGTTKPAKKSEGQKDVLVVEKAGASSDPIEEQPIEKKSSVRKPARDRPSPTKRKKKKKVASVGKPVERKPPPTPKPKKSKDKPKPIATAGGLPKTLPKSEIAGTMKKFVRAMRGCVKQQQQRDPTVSGTMLVSFTIAQNGKVDLVRILSAEHKGTYVAGCITYIIKSIKFGKFTGDPITVPRVPLRLGG